jgi:hypothetical protein
VNRLSGRFPKSFGHVVLTELNALRGNLFGCGSIPDEDEFSDEYTCGSEDLDISLYLLLAILLAVILSFLAIREAYRRKLVHSVRISAVLSIFKEVTTYTSYLDNSTIGSTKPQLAVVKIYAFGKEIRMVTKLFAISLCLNFISCIPLYGLKISQYGVDHSTYTTHSYQYRWLFSLTYLRGIVSLILLLCMWVVAVCSLRLLTARDGPARRLFPWLQKHDEQRVSVGNMEIDVEGEHIERMKLSVPKFLAIMLFNASIVGGVNGLYIHFLSQSLSVSVLIGLQLSMAVFKMGWNKGALPVLAKPMQGVEQMVQAELFLKICNDIILPCIATALTSPVCFQV